MATERIWTVSANGLEDDGVTVTDYSDPQLWDTTEAYDAVTADEIPVLEFFSHAAGVFSGTGNLLTLNGTWVTDTTRYIIIRTRPDQRHDGTPAGSTAQYTATNNAIFLTLNQTTNLSVLVQGIYFRTNASAANFNRLVLITRADNIWVDGCLGVFDQHGGNGSNFYATTTRAANIRFRNNISIDNAGGLDSHMPVRDTTSPIVTELYNNTLIGGDIGIDGDGLTLNSQTSIKNNIVQSATTNYSLLGSPITAANISSDATSPQTSLRNISLTFNNAAADDYHLASGDTDAIDAGEDLTTAFQAYPHATSVDIDGDTRPTGASTWDIGADEFVSAGGGGFAGWPIIHLTQMC